MQGAKVTFWGGCPLKNCQYVYMYMTKEESFDRGVRWRIVVVVEVVASLQEWVG